MNIDKTRTYIQRSRSSPLKLNLEFDEDINDSFPLMIPHVHRLKSLTIRTYPLPSVLDNFRFRTPLLEKLDIQINTIDEVIPDSALFDGDLPSLRNLRLSGFFTHFPWKNLANLQAVRLEHSFRPYQTTQILDLFDSAPLLRAVFLRYPMPDSSDAPPGRMVTLRHLKLFIIDAVPPQSTLLRHLQIPIGASLISEFCFHGQECPLLDYIPETPPNLNNLSHITTIHLFLSSGSKCVRLSGPSGSLQVYASPVCCEAPFSYAIDCHILQSFGPTMLSKIQRLIVSAHLPHQKWVGECPIFQTLSSMNNLRTLALVNCDTLPFILALDPKQNLSNPVLCSNMEELVLHISSYDFSFKPIVNMAKNRASRGAKLSSIVIVSPASLWSSWKGIPELSDHITHLEHRDGNHTPAWDDVPEEWRSEGRYEEIFDAGICA